ncbi:MAG: sigma-54 dependent transcriptional regulator [bacterium]|nr:sigma-54 dependent transcriptional regulator [bacterium]
MAASHGTVLITGESGVGKEVAARAVHELSPRREGPFLAVNCAALSESLLESELFGHEKGAFTGADRMRKGRFELAHGGTLLLDEVSEISPKIQAKLLRVIQERTLERVGSGTAIGVDVRIIATSNRDLQAEVERGEFRQDLFFRLNVLPLPLPSLRERREDVAVLAEHFLREACRRDGRPSLVYSPEANDALAAYSWPGNVRELQNICERAVVLWPARNGDTIGRDLLEPWLRTRSATPISAASQQIEIKPMSAVVNGVSHAPAVGLGTAVVGTQGEDVKTLEEIERETIIRTLGRFNGHRQRTASTLGIGVRTLGLKLKKWKQMKLVEDTL